MYIYIYIYIYIYKCMSIYTIIFPSYLFVVHPSGKYSSEDNLP